MLTGCVQKGLLGRVNKATERVFAANGYQLVEAPNQGCCGAIHAHTGDLTGARELARANIRAFEALELDFVAVNAAGCGATLKDYPHLLEDDEAFAERARNLAEKVRDVSELLAGDGLRRGGPLPLKVTYDAPCHLLHAQRISREPLDVLDSIPGLDRIPLKEDDECCGGRRDLRDYPPRVGRENQSGQGGGDPGHRSRRRRHGESGLHDADRRRPEDGGGQGRRASSHRTPGRELPKRRVVLMTELGARLLVAAEEEREAMLSFLMELASMESPSDVPESQVMVQEFLTRALEELGFQVERTPGRKTGRLPVGPESRRGSDPTDAAAAGSL